MTLMPRRRTSLWFFTILLVLTLGAIVIPYVFNVRQLLEPAELAVAQRRWAASGPANYELIWREKFDENGAEPTGTVYRVEVRDSRLHALTVNDKPIDLTLLSQEQRDSFLVPSLLQRMAAELNADLGSGQRRNYITAYFDPQTGCPYRYVRRTREPKTRLEWIIKLNR